MGSFVTANNPAAESPLSRALLIEAAAWVTRMNGPLRDENTEQGFTKWVNESPLHRRAFVEVMRDWEHIGEHKHDAYVVVSASPLPQPVVVQEKSRARPWFAAAAALVLVIVGGLLYWAQLGDVSTEIGEQRIITLEDGTKVYLNTATRIAVQYEAARRRVRMDAGEALFEVAKDSHRPFTVVVGEREVTALGTAFLVRRDMDRFAVTLVEGKVAVTPVKSAITPDQAAVMRPGERLTFPSDASPAKLDRPPVKKLLAWQQGRVALDNMRLDEAAAEMNRYSPIKLIIEHPEAASLPITGVFVAGQSASFARAVASSYELKVVNEGSTIVLAGAAHRRIPTNQNDLNDAASSASISTP